MINEKYITKTDGNGNELKILNPDYFNEYGKRIKRRKATNYTRPKKNNKHKKVKKRKDKVN